ncbi:hypothetical protein GCM10007938_03240 [Vibrio zhanjiangensis]|uniref:Lipoprotein n=1 Tax=Vibrio zhanjiangensis TaxID=1046128 RepID=A0ABQ6ETR3_9VIBR|nr:hypothetical protein [Vibrio zhanjiangensis]GLT16548.1 hypothetical protein GCM10007938_03240 [Vibrio zhanjiangensis]
MKNICVAVLVTFFLAGCQLNSVEGEFKDVEVKVKNKEEQSSDGNFCPPGQAKKGNC